MELECILSAHVDDFLCSGTEDDMAQLDKLLPFEFGTTEIDEFKFLGQRLLQRSTRSRPQRASLRRVAAPHCAQHTRRHTVQRIFSSFMFCTLFTARAL